MGVRFCSFTEAQLAASSLSAILALLESSFGFSSLPPQARHHTLVVDDRTIGYCASRVIATRLGDLDGQFDHLGLVSVSADQRGRGFGRQLIERFLESRGTSGLDGAILNCGEAVQGFYQKLGFLKVAKRASYLREGRIVVDEDPVLVRFYRHLRAPYGFDEVVSLGLDL